MTRKEYRQRYYQSRKEFDEMNKKLYHQRCKEWKLIMHEALGYTRSIMDIQWTMVDVGGEPRIRITEREMGPITEDMFKVRCEYMEKLINQWRPRADNPRLEAPRVRIPIPS